MPTSSLAFLRPGDVIVVPFPYSDRLAQKRRPALVVSNEKLHALGLIWAVMITSAKNSSHPSDFALADLARAGLNSPSTARPSKIVSRSAPLSTAAERRLARACGAPFSNNSTSRTEPLRYAVNLSCDDNGTLLVTVPDLPEAV